MIRSLSALLCLSGSIGVHAVTSEECAKGQADELTCEQLDGCIWFKSKEGFECITAEEHEKRVAIAPGCTKCELQRAEFKKEQNMKLSKGIFSVIGCGHFTYDDSPDEAMLQECMGKKLYDVMPSNPKCDKEQMKFCHAEFISIFEAYYTIIDPVALAKFKEEKAFKELDQSELREMYETYFQNQPAGDIKIGFNDGIRLLEEIPAIGYLGSLYADESSVYELDGKLLKAQMEARKENWLIQFYKPNQEQSVAAKAEFEKAAAALEGIASLGGVNCLSQDGRHIWHQLSAQFKNSGVKLEDFPFFAWMGKKDNDHAPYNNSNKIEGLNLRLQKFVASRLDDYGKNLESHIQMREWLDDDELPKVVLLTDEQQAPAYWVRASEIYRDRASFGTIANCSKKGEKTDLQKEFAVKRIPAIIQIDRSGEVGAIVDTFKAPFQLPHIKKFVKKFAKPKAKKGQEL